MRNRTSAIANACDKAHSAPLVYIRQKVGEHCHGRENPLLWLALQSSCNAFRAGSSVRCQMANATSPGLVRPATSSTMIGSGMFRTLTVSALTALTFAGSVAFTSKAAAQSAIGGTVVVQNDVRSQKVGKRNFLKLRKGAHVFQDDLVRTQKSSLTKIVFLDKTNMSVGPESEAKLDKFVYNGDGTAKDVVINATKGTFRFFSGKSSSKAYRVLTPRAVIGVRGTTYDVRITPGGTMVVLQEGEVNVCVRNTANCRVMNQPGQSLNVDDTGITDPFPPAAKTWDFASNCTGSASVLCAKTTQFALAPQPPTAAPKPTVKPKRAAPRRKVRRTRARPTRQRNIRPKRRTRRIERAAPPRRRTVRRPPGRYIEEPIYDPPPRRRPIIEEPIYVPPRRCYPGSRHPRCRTVRPRPRPCYGVWRRGRCISRPIVRPRPKPCTYSRHGCGRRPIVRPRPRPPVHGRPIYRPEPPTHGRPSRPGRPSYGKPSRRPTYERPSRRPSYGRPSRGTRPGYRPRRGSEGRTRPTYRRRGGSEGRRSDRRRGRSY